MGMSLASYCSFTPTDSSPSHRHLLSVQGDGGKNQKLKKKENAWTEIKTAYQAVCVQSKTRNSFVTSHWQPDVQPLPGKQASSCVMVIWEDKHHDSKHPPLSFSLPIFY